MFGICFLIHSRSASASRHRVHEAGCYNFMNNQFASKVTHKRTWRSWSLLFSTFHIFFAAFLFIIRIEKVSLLIHIFFCRSMDPRRMEHGVINIIIISRCRVLGRAQTWIFFSSLLFLHIFCLHFNGNQGILFRKKKIICKLSHGSRHPSRQAVEKGIKLTTYLFISRQRRVELWRSAAQSSLASSKKCSIFMPTKAWNVKLEYPFSFMHIFLCVCLGEPWAGCAWLGHTKDYNYRQIVGAAACSAEL